MPNFGVGLVKSVGKKFTESQIHYYYLLFNFKHEALLHWKGNLTKKRGFRPRFIDPKTYLYHTNCSDYKL